MAQADKILESIIKELGDLPSEYPNPHFLIHNLQSDVKRDNVYDPEIVAIGFYNHKEDYLQDMQTYKLIKVEESVGVLRAFHFMKPKPKNVRQKVQLVALSSVSGVGRENNNADKIVKAVVGMRERARKWYGGRVDPDEGIDFVKMLVIDGCFLIELLRCYGLDNWRDPNDPIFKYERILSQLRHDIVLNDNQIPFFVLNDLFNMSRSKEPKDDLILLTLNFVKELHRTGIDFKISKDHNSLMDIKFVRKCLGAKLKIPQLNIYYETESQIRNLVAYEQYLPYGNPRYVSDYTFFMHCLINTSEDVELLRRSGIIGNWLGNDEEHVDVDKFWKDI
ncbi:UNVERIFIED_CONTAM: hypothetical protein Sangu_1664100 [Sesamum angustifolium]|uniref:Uncharacterized protein n=1 Tax=Sesamum angustifolium TaxID=2727405 RepID=A0AAW2MJ43_9LAMI